MFEWDQTANFSGHMIVSLSKTFVKANVNNLNRGSAVSSDKL